MNIKNDRELLGLENIRLIVMSVGRFRYEGHKAGKAVFWDTDRDSAFYVSLRCDLRSLMHIITTYLITEAKEEKENEVKSAFREILGIK